MAVVEYADAIKTVSGALTKINKKSPHAKDQKMVLATHRTAPTTSGACSRLYLRGLDSITRTTPLTQEELTVRELFRARSRWIKTRMEDLSKVTTDQAAFIAQKNEAGGAKTLKAYYWKLAKEQIDENSLNG